MTYARFKKLAIAGVFIALTILLVDQANHSGPDIITYRVTFYPPGGPPRLYWTKGEVDRRGPAFVFTDRDTGAKVQVSGNVVVVTE